MLLFHHKIPPPFSSEVPPYTKERVALIASREKSSELVGIINRSAATMAISVKMENEGLVSINTTQSL